MVSFCGLCISFHRNRQDRAAERQQQTSTPYIYVTAPSPVDVVELGAVERHQQGPVPSFHVTAPSLEDVVVVETVRAVKALDSETACLKVPVPASRKRHRKPVPKRPYLPPQECGPLLASLPVGPVCHRAGVGHEAARSPAMGTTAVRGQRQ
ncbi:hypothetical protein B0A50_08003 [Salinomyces thailandicus]|uniref:Uncharacterized protein n=1 Tax=Salinomyces thailandicus TaxID=706561 RepID=A0A4U0TKP3_9PEZI|nr:hypothetical protein B0A50_08003 [Salinomyces thailandica]